MATSPSELSRIGRLADRGFYRSVPMALIQLYIPTESVFTVTAELGEVGLIQFCDLNSSVSPLERLFTMEIRKLDELERKLLFLMDQAVKEDVEIRPWMASSTGMVDRVYFSFRGKAASELDELEAQLSETESRIIQMDENQTEIMSRYLRTLECFGVMHALSPFLAGSTDILSCPKSSMDRDSIDLSKSTHYDDEVSYSMEMGGVEAMTAADEANFIAGAIPKRKLAAFERVLWRALRGNVLIRSADCHIDPRGLVTDPDILEPKSAFIAYVHGRETLSKLRKICEALGASLYDVDPDARRRCDVSADLALKLDDMYAILFNTRQAKRAALGSTSESLEKFLLVVRKKKAIFDIMNHFGCDSDASTRKYYVAEGWCPKDSLGIIDASIKTASERAGISVAPVMSVLDFGCRTPPTYFRTNKLTKPFQDMTDSYSDGKYGEANPSLFMIISFPFLFAVMFGDVGHGMFIALVALFLIAYERKLGPKQLDEIVRMVFDARYVILLMGLFSIFSGFIYNDFASRTLFIFPSAWNFKSDGSSVRTGTYVYPFGIDPAWFLAGNAQAFINSYKMKTAVILGVIQMTLGIFVNMHNQIYFRNWVDLICNAIPQFLFFESIMGYLALMIIYKWISGWDVSILSMFISMFLKLGAVEGISVYPGQSFVQLGLLMIATICVPWMLLAKPLYMLYLRKRDSRFHTTYQQASEQSDSTGSESVSSTTRKAAAEDDENDLSEVWVHQMIHTIEFVLGAISNTASYLRLWALSLSHSELSDVLWSQSIGKAFGNPIALFIVFPFWLYTSIFILIVLEGLSSFLHALRLHWVEFNNKFYVGGGIKFEPFSLGDDQQFLMESK